MTGTEFKRKQSQLMLAAFSEGIRCDRGNYETLVIAAMLCNSSGAFSSLELLISI